MLEPRLAAVRDALSPIGSLWLHLDHRAVHDAKVLTDRVFGRTALPGRSDLGARQRRQTAHGPERHSPNNPDLRPRPRADLERRRPGAARASRRNQPAHAFPERGRRRAQYRDRHVAGKTYRYYADRGRRIGSVWSDCPSMRANTPLIKEATGYPTQKPESLLERIVRAATRSKIASCSIRCTARAPPWQPPNASVGAGSASIRAHSRTARPRPTHDSAQTVRSPLADEGLRAMTGSAPACSCCRSGDSVSSTR